jgi:hypothetical protein
MKEKITTMPTPSVLQDSVHQNPIFAKGAAPLKLDQFEVEVQCILLG